MNTYYVKFIIAFALSSNCKLLLLDEPTNGLDIPSKAQFKKVLAGAISDEQTVIISTHQVRDIENLIDRVVVIDNGKEIFNQNIDRSRLQLENLEGEGILTKNGYGYQIHPFIYRPLVQILKKKNILS